MLNLKSVPFFKILIPYLLGIPIVLNVGFIQSFHTFFLFSSVSVVFFYLIQKHGKASRNKQWLYILSFNVFLIFLAQETCWFYQSKHQKEHYSHFIEKAPQQFIGTINEMAVEKDKFVKIPFNIEVIQFQNKWHYSKGDCIIYLKKDSITKYQLGQRLYFNASFGAVNEPKNINEFNYKSFLENKNINHVVYVQNQQVHVLSNNTNLSSCNFGLFIKQKVVDILRSSELTQQAFSICCALLVGYDDEIENDVMQSFAHSGTLHVLSVSGMHTGLIFGLIVWIFSIFDKYEKHKLLKCITTIGILILFTFITGFTPSVLRASIMLSFIVIGNTFYRNGNNYNTLFLSAFLMLLYNPLLIVDVGFLLSYSAVFGIMYFYPIFQQWYFFENKIIQWAWSLTMMSVAATITTLPISLYVFHQFPIWFAFSNLFIIPLSTILMALSALLIIVCKIAILKTGIVYLINLITSAMLWIADLTNNSNYGFIDNISFNGMDALFLVLVILFAVLVFTTKQFKKVVWLCSIIIIWLLYSIAINYKQLQEQEFMVFHVKNQNLCAFRNGKTIYFDQTHISNDEFNRILKPYLLQFSGYQLVPTKVNYFQINHVKVLHHSFSINNESKLDADFIIVSNNEFIDVSKCDSKQTIIADCSNSYNFVKKLKQQCLKKGVFFYDIRDKGVFNKIINIEG